MAESAFNFQYIQTYSKEYATRVCNGYFRNKTSINGKEILEITGIRQINLLIIRELYSAWQAEIEKHKGAYFNYNAPEVQEALNNLRNVLSNNILVERPLFESLLASAVDKTLMLIFSPYEFFIAQFNSSKKDFIFLDDLIKERKYIKINRHLYDALLRKLEEKNISREPRNRIIDVFNEVCGIITETPADADQYIHILSKIFPLDMKQVYLEKDIIHERKVPWLETGEQENKKILLDEFQNETTDTIADFLQRKTIESIRKSITINQKFMFVKELFAGDEILFNTTIYELDNIDNLEAAGQYLDEKFFNPNRWQRDHEFVKEFLNVLEKKFS